MSSQGVNIDLKYESRLHDSVLLTLNSVPYATAIYMSKTDHVYLNKFAFECLEMKENEEFDLEKWTKLNPHLDKILERNNQNILFNQKTLITLFSGKKEVISFNISILRETSFGDIHIIYFCKASTKYSVSSISTLYMIKDEIKRLKPYLNNAGKSMHEEIMLKYFHADNQSVALDDLMYFEREMTIIQTTFPSLSHQEVIICSLLVNNMNNDEISILTKKSTNSIFVMIHRINKKLKVKDRTDLMALLNWITKTETEEKEDNLPVVDDFDL